MDVAKPPYSADINNDRSTYIGPHGQTEQKLTKDNYVQWAPIMKRHLEAQDLFIYTTPNHPAPPDVDPTATPVEQNIQAKSIKEHRKAKNASAGFIYNGCTSQIQLGYLDSITDPDALWNALVTALAGRERRGDLMSKFFTTKRGSMSVKEWINKLSEIRALINPPQVAGAVARPAPVIDDNFMMMEHLFCNTGPKYNEVCTQMEIDYHSNKGLPTAMTLEVCKKTFYVAEESMHLQNKVVRFPQRDPPPAFSAFSAHSELNVA